VRTRALLALAALVPLAACSDGSPTATSPVESRLTLAYDCSVTVATGEMRCSQPRVAGGWRGDIILGGNTIQLSNRNLSVTSTAMTFEVAVRNLIPQKLGTTDGFTLDANGIRVFFHSGPIVTSGTGTMTVVPDGYGLFTGTNQAYYQYDQILAPNEQSSWKTWTFTLTPTVNTFAFIVYVSAPVQFPDGWVTVSPDSLYVPVDNDWPLTATAYNKFGVEIPGATFSWSSSNPSVAVVTSSGDMTAMDIGTAIMTATNGPRSGTAKIVVF
jgi:hypothetical protein